MTVPRRMADRDPRLYFYDTIADRFDELVNAYDLRRRLEIVFGELLAAADLTGLSVLDVGCGSGWFSREAQRRGARVTSLDIALRLLHETRRKLTADRVNGDACALPFADASFDLVISSECIEHTLNPGLALAEIHRVTRPGGRLLVTVPNQAWHFSATIAAAFKLRPFEGYEHWLGWWEIRRLLGRFDARIDAMRGFHLVPPLFRVTWPLLRRIDTLGAMLGPAMLNIAVLATKADGSRIPDPGSRDPVIVRSSALNNALNLSSAHGGTRVVMPRHGSVRALGACVVGLLLASTAAAQVVPGGSLTLQAAMDRAFSANPTIAAARLRGAIDLANLALAEERLNPDASVEISKETPKQAFGFAVPLELGGKRSKRIAVGEAAIRAGEAEVAATVAQVRNDVRRAYYGFVVADARLALMNEMRDIAVRVRDTAQQRFESGSAPRLEVMQAQLTLASAENETTAAQGSAVAARAQLNALLGQPLDTVTSLSTAVDAGEPPTTEAAMTLAQTTSTELILLDRQIEAQRARILLARALRVPDVIPTATLTHDAQPEFTYGWRAGVAVTLPLFTSHRSGVLVEQTTLDQLTAQRQAALVRINGAVTAAAVTVQAQRQLYGRYRDEIIPQAQQIEQLAQESYQLGQTGIAALLQALQATRDARLRAIDAVSLFQNALADLERAIGAPLP